MKEEKRYYKRNREEGIIRTFLEFDKEDNKIYDDYYLCDFNIVIKIPLFNQTTPKSKMKIEDFNLSNNVFLTSY